MNQPAFMSQPTQAEQSFRNNWQEANLKLLAKTLSELSWEEAITPSEIIPIKLSNPVTSKPFEFNRQGGVRSHSRSYGDDSQRRILDSNGCAIGDFESAIGITSGHFNLNLDSGVSYQFSAWRSIWGQLVIEPGTILRTPSLTDSTKDASQFFIDARTELGFSSATLCNFLEELGNTLMADVELQNRHRLMTASDMIDLAADQLQALLDGHPKVTVNKGRMGWGLDDFQAFATEFTPEIQLEWLAVSRQKCQLVVADNLDEDRLLDATLNKPEQERLLQQCAQEGIDRSQYVILPVHPWQWLNKIVNLFAGEIAAGHIIHLGHFGDPMLPQQSLRTLSNGKRPEELNIKLPLSILNTSCYRGIPGRYITAGPTLSKWLADIARRDEVLACRGTIILEELAGAFYTHPLYDQIADGPYRYHEMLGCIWRQSVQSKTAPGEQSLLISTLFQKDGYGQPLIKAYIDRSGLNTEAWLRKLFNVVVIPLYHLLCKYGVGLVAHGQNVSVVLAEHSPVKVALKDFQGDLRLVDQNFPELESLPESVRSVTTRLPADHLIHDLQTGHFVSVLRFISSVLAETGFSEHRFYQLLGEQLQHYMTDHPEMSDRFEQFDLFTPGIARICLNRVRFRLGYDDSCERPLPELGSNLTNPLALTLQG